MPDNSFRGLFVSRPVQALSIRGQWPIVCVHSRPVIISPPRIHSYTEHAAAGSRGTRSPLVPCGVNVLLCLLFSLLSWSESRLNIEVGGKKRNKRIKERVGWRTRAVEQFSTTWRWTAAFKTRFSTTGQWTATRSGTLVQGCAHCSQFPVY